MYLGPIDGARRGGEAELIVEHSAPSPGVNGGIEATDGDDSVVAAAVTTRRLWIRGIVWGGIALTVMLGLAMTALVLVTQTAYGRERLVQITERLARRYLLGSLHLGALRFGPGCALAIDSAAVRDADDSLLVAVGPSNARCRFGALVHGRLIITAMEVTRPHIVARQSATGVWNWSRLIRPDTEPAPPSNGPSRAVVTGRVRVHDGTVVLEVPWAPPDSLRGARRDSAIAAALDAGNVDVRRVAGALVRRRVFSRLAIDAPTVRTSIGDTTASLQLTRFTVVASDPAITLHRIRGRVAVVGDNAFADLSAVELGRSSARASGRIGWGASGTPAMDVRVTVGTLAFGDLAWISPMIPHDGGGRLEVAIRSAGGVAPVDYMVTDADLRTTGSAIRGGLTVRMNASGEPSLVIRDVAVDLAPLHMDLVRLVAGDAIPRTLSGAVTARLVASGGPIERLRIDTLDARFVDSNIPGAVNRMGARGTIGFGGEGIVSFAGLALDVDPIEVRTLARIVPSVPPLVGRVRGTLTLDSTLQNLHIARADLRYAEADGPPLRITGTGRVSMGDAVGFDMRLETRPLAPAALAKSYPALASLPSVDGPVRLQGSASDVSITGQLRGARAGTLALVARYRSDAPGVAIRATAHARGVDPRHASGRSDLPTGALDADLELDLRGDSLSSLVGTATLRNLRGEVAGVAVKPSIVRLRVTESGLEADTVSLATSAGAMDVRGALGRHRGVRDTVHVTASASLAALMPVLRALAPPDTGAPASSPAPASDTAQRRVAATSDSLAGNVTVRARLVGSLDSLDVSGEAEGVDLAAGPARVRRARVSGQVSSLPGTPRGRAELRVDSLTAGGVVLTTVAAVAASGDGERWRVSLGTDARDRPGGDAVGSVLLRPDTVAVELDSLVVRLPGTDVRLLRPTRLRRDSGGTIALDTIELRGTQGAVFRAAGLYRDAGAISVTLDITDAPVFLPGPGGASDTTRLMVGASARLSGTAAAPRGEGRARAQLVTADSIPVDSVIADVVYEDRRARVSVDARGDDRSMAAARATVPVAVSLAPLKAALLDEPLEGEVSIDSLLLPDVTRFVPGLTASAGVLRTRVTLAGTARRPRALGTASVRDGAVRIAALGVGIRDANAAIELGRDRIAIREASARSADVGGRAEISGYVGVGDRSTVDLRVRAREMPVMRASETADLDVSADLHLAGPSARPTLSGRVTVERGVIRLPDMGRQGVAGADDTAFVRLVDSLAPAGRATPAPSPLEHLEIGDVAVAMGPDVWLRSAEASVQLGGTIRLTKATPGPDVRDRQLALRGTLVTQRGDYRLDLGAVVRTFQLERGSIQFLGDAALDARLDINAIYSREMAEGAAAARRSPRVRAHLGGTLERPTLTLSSADASLTQAELMSYLVTGQASFALGDAFDQSVLTGELVGRAANAVAQRVAGGFFDVVNVTPGAADSGGPSSATGALAASRLGLGKQLSNRVFVNVDAGLCAVTGDASSTDIGQTLGVSLDYRFRRDLLASLSSAPSTNGGACASQAAGRGTALTPRQWGLDVDRRWRF